MKAFRLLRLNELSPSKLHDFVNILSKDYEDVLIGRNKKGMYVSAKLYDYHNEGDAEFMFGFTVGMVLDKLIEETIHESIKLSKIKFISPCGD